jgi:prophage antirepressor-like protein
LGYNNPLKAIRDHVDEDDKGVNVSFTPGGKQKTTIINESGLYSLILSSKLPQAKAFKRWVTNEVLPQIARTGGYIPTKDATGRELSDLEVMCLAFQIQKKTIEERDRMIDALTPKAIYCDQVLDSVDCLTTTQVAKGMGMTANELNIKLCQAGIQYGQSGQYLLYAQYARRGLAQNRTHSYYDNEGNLHTTTYMVWTEAGRQFIHNLFNN